MLVRAKALHQCVAQLQPVYFFFSSRGRHTRWPRDWSSDVCSSDLVWSHGSLVSSLGKCHLDDVLIRLSRADEATVGPDGSPHPLPLFDDLRVCLVYDFAHFRERLPAPVPKFLDLLSFASVFPRQSPSSLIFSSINAEADSTGTGLFIYSSNSRAYFTSNPASPATRRRETPTTSPTWPRSRRPCAMRARTT